MSILDLIDQLGWDRVVLGVVVLVIVVSGLVFTRYKRTRTWSTLMKQTAERLGMEHEQADRRVVTELVGQVDGFPVSVRTLEPRTGRMSVAKIQTCVEVGGLPADLRLHRRGVVRGLLAGTSALDGVQDLDRGLAVRGPDASLLAAFDARTRRLAETAVQTHKARLEDGRVQSVLPGRLKDVDQLVGIGSDLLELAKALRLGVTDVPGRLLHNTFEDPDPSFRRRCMKHLVRQHGRTDEAAAAIRRGRTSEAPDIRYLALHELDDEGLDGIHELVQARSLPDALHAEALALLAPRYGGGLSVEPAAGGELSVEHPQEGALSSAEPKRPKRRQRQ